MMHADRVYGALRRFGLDAERGRRGRAGGVPARLARPGAIRGARAVLDVAVPDRVQRGPAAALAPRAAARRARSRSRDDPVASLPESPDLGPEAQTLDREFERTLERALAQLPAEWRAAVVLRDIEGLSTQEAAEIVGVRQAAFKSRLHRGRMQLRALLEPYLRLEEG